MKINLKAKDFFDKENLESTLSTKLKKPLMALRARGVDNLPFCYEVDYFGDGRGFISIGISKEVDKLYKTKRSKGQGQNGKIDKKKVAYGTISYTSENVFEFSVLGGIMKEMQAKKVIKSIPILKKVIKDNFIIIKGAVPVLEKEADATSEETSKKSEDSGKSDSTAPKKQALQLVNAFKKFIAEEWKAVKENGKSAKVILLADKKGQAIFAKMTEWLTANQDNSELALENEAVISQSEKLSDLLNKIKAVVDKIKKAQAEKSNVDLDTISVDITGKVAELMGTFAKEIEAIDGLKEALEAVK